MRDDANSHEFLAVVAAVHHERVGQTLDDGALSLAEAFHCVPPGGVRYVDGLADLDVVAMSHCSLAFCSEDIRRTYAPIILHSRYVRQRDIPNLDIFVAPLIEELRAADFLRDILR